MSDVLAHVLLLARIETGNDQIGADDLIADPLDRVGLVMRCEKCWSVVIPECAVRAIEVPYTPRQLADWIAERVEVQS